MRCKTAMIVLSLVIVIAGIVACRRPSSPSDVPQAARTVFPAEGGAVVSQ